MPVRGLRVDSSSEVGRTAETAILDMAKAFATRMTEHMFFSHVTAAVLWDVPLPAGVLVDSTLDVSVFTPRRNPRGLGIRGHEVPPALATRMPHPDLGLALASPASTWAMLGSVLEHPFDLIAAGDALVRTPQHPDDPIARTSVRKLAAASAAGRRVGGRALRAAWPCVRDGASSRPETWTRLTLIEAGLPEPVLALPVYDRGGGFVGRVDMAYPEWKIAIEYEGTQHLLDPAQFSKDILRYERLAAEGWVVIRVTKTELFDHPEAVATRVRRAIERASR
jgi:hypothetical protein